MLIKNTTRVLHVFLFLLYIPFCYGQNEENIAEKYKDAYKAYTSATCPIATGDNIKHFVYFIRDREKIIDHPFLKHSRFKGAQIMYFWKDFEPKKGQYDFSVLQQDYEYLKKHGKKLFVQLQDATFYSNYISVPDYLLTDEYDGGVTAQHNDNEAPEGWVAKRWNAKVRERFALFLTAMGKVFDGKIEGVNLQETAIGVSQETDPSFSEQKYVVGLKANMSALKKAFPTSTTMIYANFMPGEWLPWEDKGYLRGIYQYGEEIGVGLGGPDLMVKKRGQLNHALTLMHEADYSVPIGIAVQDGNYIGETGDTKTTQDNLYKSIVPLLHQFAKDFLKVDYMFWVDQEPYFKETVLPCFAEN